MKISLEIICLLLTLLIHSNEFRGIVPFWSEVGELSQRQNQGQLNEYPGRRSSRSRGRSISHRANRGYGRTMDVSPVMDELDDDYRARRRSSRNFMSGADDSPMISSRVSGGTEAQQIVPFMVSIALTMNEGKGHFCGGALISKRTVLTAASCLVDKTEGGKITWRKITDFRVRYDGLDRFKLITSNQPAKFVAHPWFTFAPEKFINLNNIAVIHLKDQVVESDRVTIIPLADQRPADYEGVEFYGWGLTNFTDGKGNYEGAPARLQAAKLNIIPTETCNRMVAPFPGINRKEVCALGIKVSPCYGDMGGPLVYNGEVVGINIASSYSCKLSSPSAFILANEKKEWIDENTI